MRDFIENVESMKEKITKNSTESIKEDILKRLNNQNELLNNIFFIGYMGTGKTTVLKYISDEFKLETLDIDETIMEREKKSVKEIFNEHGEKYFRDLETDMLKELQARKGLIISCGGGIILRDENIAIMRKNSKVVLFTASAGEIYSRLRYNTTRPLLSNNLNEVFIKNMMDSREPQYNKAAHLIVSTENRTVEDIALEIMSQIH